MNSCLSYTNHFIVLIILIISLSCENEYHEKVIHSDNKIQISIDTMTLEIIVESHGILNFRYYPLNTHPEFVSLSRVNKIPTEVKYQWKLKDDHLRITTMLVNAEINLNTGSIHIRDKSKNTLFHELPVDSKRLELHIAENDTGFSSIHKFCFQEDEAIYGFGQHQDGVMNYRGKSVELFQHNMKVAVPVMISSKGYGLFWDNYSYSKFEDKENASFWSEMGDGLNFYFIYGPETDQVVSGIRTLTGKASMMPRWAFGLIQSKAKYDNQEEILDVVRRYRELKVPLDLIVQDWQYWPNGWWGFKEFDSLRFPDPKKMIEDIHEEYNCHYMISIWPCLEPGSRDYSQMDSAGFLFPGANDDERRYYNAFDPEARKLFWHQIKNGLFKYDVDAWWCDATEPEINGWETNIGDYKRLMKLSDGSSCRYLNAYSLMQAEGIYSGQRSETDDKRVVNLTRSAFTGQQRYGAITWSGDVSANWETLHNQISAGLNLSVTGIPYWTSDIGAFFVNSVDWFRTGIFPDGVKDPAYHEFFIRWFQFGVFSPLFRVHGAQTPREIWNFGKPGDPSFDIQVYFNNLRYRLLPYIYTLAGMTYQQDYTIIRPLVMDFNNDQASLDINDQYMFGPSFLVNPVTRPGVASRSVYLPENPGGWYNFWTGNKYAGGQTIDAKASLDIIPLFVKAGSIIPMGPFLQYTSEKKADSLELRIYPGQDAVFTLYEDEGVNYNYENGEFSKIHFTWKDKEKILEISDQTGSFKNMSLNKTFTIIKVNHLQGTALNIPEQEGEIVNYSGKQLKIKLL